MIRYFPGASTDQAMFLHLKSVSTVYLMQTKRSVPKRTYDFGEWSIVSYLNNDYKHLLGTQSKSSS
jgi:hypothetical protein